MGETILTAVREQSRGELRADGTIHVIGLAVGISGALVLIGIAAVNRGWAEVATVVAYSAGLVAMLSFSAAYNMAHRSRFKPLLRRLDHAAIFVMIAGTYTPFTILGLEGGWRIWMTVLVWGIAAIGVGIKLFAPVKRSTRLSTILYLAFGWVGVIAIGPLLRGVGPPALILLAVGGALYTLGTIFHALQRMPYQNAIWHGFVLAAAAAHFAAVTEMVSAG
jgi:hemolysin III